MGDKDYSTIIVPEIINVEDEVSQDEKLGSLGILPEGAPDVLRPGEEIEKEGFLDGIKDKFLQGKDAAAEAIKQAFIQNQIQKITHCLPLSDHPTKKRPTKTYLKSKRKREKIARRRNRRRK